MTILKDTPTPLICSD